jgi:hypothetical protein
MKELSLSESTDLIMEIILGGKRDTNPICDNSGMPIRQSKDKQEHAKLRVVEKLFDWEKQGYRIVKIDLDN